MKRRRLVRASVEFQLTYITVSLDQMSTRFDCINASQTVDRPEVIDWTSKQKQVAIKMLHREFASVS